MPSSRASSRWEARGCCSKYRSKRYRISSSTVGFISSTRAVEFAVPLHKTGDAGLNRRAGPETDSLLQIGDVCHCRRNIARLHGQQVQRGVPAQSPLQCGDAIEEWDGTVIANIEDPIWRITGRRIR